MNTIRCLLPIALAAGIACGQTNTAEHFAGTSATISNTLSLAGGAAQGSGSFAHGYSMASGEYSVALGFGAMALHDRSFVWSDVTNPPIVSKAPGQFIVHATNGIFLLGGKVYGDASGLTNIGAGAVLGLGSAALADSGAFASSLQGLRADTALQSDGSKTWAADQNAAGRVLTNLAGAFVAKVLDQSYIQTNAVITALNVYDVCDEWGTRVAMDSFPYVGSYSGDTTNGFGFITRDSQGNWSFPYSNYHDSEAVGPLDLTGNGGSCLAAYCQAAYVVLRDESENVIGLEITGGSPVDGVYSGDGSCFSSASGVYMWNQGDGWYGASYYAMEDYSLGNFGTNGAPSGSYWFQSYWMYYGACFQIDPVNTTTFVPVAQFATNAIPLEVADGRNAWVGEHNGGGFDLVNLGELRAQTVVGNGAGLSNVGLTALDLNAVDTRYLLKQGDRLTGNLTVATIVDQSYYVTNARVTALVLHDVSGQSTYSGMEGTYPGDTTNGFGPLIHDAQWNWGYEYGWYDESAWSYYTTFCSLGNFGAGAAPSGSFWHSHHSLIWNWDNNSYEHIWENTEVAIQQVTTNDVVLVPQFATNSVPFEVADGRHAWSGEHNGGGFNLINVGQLHAQAVVGDGSGLSDVGLSALDLTDVDGRYVRKDGDTVTGNLAVTGTVTADAITVGGRPVATLTFIPQQGDISMGSFTNVPPQP